MLMIRFALSALFLLVFSGCSQEETWAVQVGGANVDSVFGIAGLEDGRACITGTFIATADFGTRARPLTLDSGGYSDIFVSCYRADGTPEYVTHFGVTQKNDQPRAITALPGGDVAVTGFFSKTLGTEPGPVLQAPGRANADIFLARVDANGNTVWARRFGGTKADSGRALATDGDGNLLLAGTFQDVIPYTENGVGHKLASAGSRDAFLFKLSADGDIIWARRFGGSASDEAFAVTATDNGTIVMAGIFAGEASSGDLPARKSAGYNDIFVQAFSADGVPLWTRTLGGAGQEYVGGLTATGDGGVWLAGSFQQEMVLPGGGQLVSEGSTDAFIVYFNSDGNLQRASSFGGAEVELVYGITAAADGSLWLAGHFQGEADLAPGSATSVYRASGTADTEGFVLALDSDGNHRDALLLAGDDVAIANGITVSAGGAVIATGIFGKEMQIGPGDKLTSRGKSDVFVLRTSL